MGKSHANELYWQAAFSPARAVDWLSEIPHSEGTWQRISTRDTAWPSLCIGLSVADRVHIREVKGGLHAGFPEDPLSNRHVG